MFTFPVMKTNKQTKNIVITVQAPLINLCVHPKSLPRKVVEPSHRHASSGSTVDTFLTQLDLASEFDYEPSLVDIDELSEHGSDDDHNNGDNL